MGMKAKVRWRIGKTEWTETLVNSYAQTPEEMREWIWRVFLHDHTSGSGVRTYDILRVWKERRRG